MRSPSRTSTSAPGTPAATTASSVWRRPTASSGAAFREAVAGDPPPPSRQSATTPARIGSFVRITFLSLVLQRLEHVQSGRAASGQDAGRDRDDDEGGERAVRDGEATG